jgi:hypothetical protein
MMPIDTTPVTNLPHRPPAAPRVRRLTEIVEMLSQTPAVRPELVADIRRQVANGEYSNEEKLDLAIYRMLKGVLE